MCTNVMVLGNVSFVRYFLIIVGILGFHDFVILRFFLVVIII